MLSLDIETKAKPEWEKIDDKAALNPYRSTITIVATADNSGGVASWDVASVVNSVAGRELLGHNLKFDLRHLITHGYALNIDQLCEDTQLMAIASPTKVDAKYLKEYEEKRSALNKEAGKEIHRKAGRYSLKVLAPYFLGVAPFWEVDGHQDLNYAKKDAVYTWELYQYFNKLFEGYPKAREFYKNRLIPWARMILTAELRGVQVDNDLLNIKEQEAQRALESAQASLDIQWAEHHKAFHIERLRNLRNKYDIMMKNAIARRSLKTPVQKIIDRYDALYATAAEKEPTKVNFRSPVQLKWLLKGRMGLDIETFDGEDESTGKAVLQRLAGEDSTNGVRTFLEYRQQSKLVDAFFPTYRDIQINGTIHCTFNMGGTRTGRLSCNEPNLQQVPKGLRVLFRARPGYRLVVRDLSSIEPFLIAYASEDKNLCNLLLEERNFHSNNVRVLAGISASDVEIKQKYNRERDLVKEIALSLFYGAGPGRMEESSSRRGIPWTYGACRNKHKAFREEYAGVYEFKEELDEKLHNSELVYNIFNRPVFVEDPDQIFMTGFNTYIQSSGSDMLLDWAYKSWKSFKGEAHPLLFVHDELIFEVPTNDADAFDNHLTNKLAEYNLSTQWGTLKLKCEGGVCETWTK
jgi:DNA polymerase I-like protein with 3'-5' exonuclease and polymerase domains